MIVGSMGSGPASAGSIGMSLAGLNGVPCSLGASCSEAAAAGKGRLRIIASGSPSAVMSCAGNNEGFLAVDVVHSERHWLL